ncbi:MAG: DUF2846 domain-containing protein [Caulobacteraceae bacterium]
MRNLLAAGLGVAALLGTGIARAQPPVSTPVAEADQPCCRVPAGAPVAVQLVDPIDTAHAKTGDLFKLRLAAPLIVDGQVILPVGTTGVGQVIQSSGPGIGGKGAKLVVSAEYLDVPGGQVKLGGMQLTGTGKDHTKASGALGLAGLAFMPLGIVGIAVTGDNIEIPAGVAAAAKIGESVVLAPRSPATAEDYQRVQAVFGAPETTRGWIDIGPPPNGMGQVVFYRPKSMLNVQWFNVRENGEALGKLTNGAYFVTPLAPGVHSFTAKSEPELKDHLTLKVDPGETYFVEAAMTHGLVLGAAELVPSQKARFDAVSGDLEHATEVRANNGRGG